MDHESPTGMRKDIFSACFNAVFRRAFTFRKIRVVGELDSGKILPLFPSLAKMPSHSPIYDTTAQVLAPLEPYVPRSLFRWESGKTPLSTFPVVVACMATYLITIFSLRALISTLKGQKKPQPQNGKAKEGKPQRELPLIPSKTLKYPFLVHNVALSAGSGLLLALMLEEVLPIIARNGSYYSICSQGAWTMRMETFYIINYYL